MLQGIGSHFFLTITLCCPRSLEPLPLGDQYWNIRDAMVQSELLLLRMCQFGVKFTHPHKYLLHYLKSLKDWMSAEVWAKYPVAKVSWSLLQVRTLVCLYAQYS